MDDSSIQPSDWAAIKAWFDRLVSCPPDEQERALQDLGQHQSVVRREVVRLLAHARSASSTGIIDGHAADLLVLDAGPPPPAFGRLIVQRRIGAGGMGVVYEAFDPLRGARVALKALARATPGSIALFKNEFRSLADVHHPHLVTLYDFFEHDGRWFFSMEYVDGSPLLPYLAASPDRWGAVRRSLAALADGLAFLHTTGKLHRDVKPSNVMVTHEGRVVVLDFGLVAEVAPGADTSFAGTPSYASPEQIRREPLTTASDCYSLGALLFEALTGDVPAAAAARPLAPGRVVPTAGRYGPIPGELAGLCEALLELDPARRPTAADIARSSGASVASLGRAPARHQATPFVGRNEDVRELEAALDAAAAGPVVYRLESASGMGKSALVRHFLARRAAVRPGITLSSRCYERESISFNVFDSLGDELNAYLRGLEPGTFADLLPAGIDALGRMIPRLGWLGELARQATRMADDQELRRAGIGALGELLRTLSRASTPVVFVDDVHWCDLDSAEMLLELLSGPRPIPLLMILAFRSEERARRAPLAHLLTGLAALPAVDLRERTLPPLAPESALAIASHLLAGVGGTAPRPEQVAAVARESGGHPYFLGELATYAAMPAEAETARASDQPTLASLIHARARQLPGHARRLLETVSLAGGPIRSADALAAALGEAPDITCLAILRSDRFVRAIAVDGDELLEPFHDRVRETIVDALPPAERRGRHLALATILERSPAAEPELLAIHFEQAGEHGRAGTYYLRSADQAAATLAFNSAAARYERALGLDAFVGERRLEIMRMRATALANAGRAFEAAEAFKAASVGHTHEGLVSLSRAGYHFAASGRVSDAKTIFATVNSRLGIRTPLDSRFALPRLLILKARLGLRGYRVRASEVTPLEGARADACWFIGAGLGLVELMTGALFTSQALALAVKAGDARRVARGLSWEAAIAASQSRGGKKRAVELFQTCREIVESLQDPYCRAMLELCEGLADFSHGRWADARRRLDAAERLFTEECVGVSFELATLNGFKLQTCVYAGEYRDLRALAPGLLDAARSSRDLYAETFIVGAIQPLLQLADDRPDLARASAESALARWTSPGYHLQHALIDQVRLCIELYDGAADRALALITAIWPQLRRSGLLFNQNLRAKLLEVKAKCLVAAPTGMSRAAAARAIARLDREREGYFAGSVQCLRATVLRSAGAAADAEALLAQAVTSYEAAAMSDYAASSAVRLSAWRSDSAKLAEACIRLRNEGIVAPERWAHMRVPAAIIGSAR